MAVVNQNSPKVKLPGKEKLLIAGLLCLEVPSAIFFIPLATVLVLTGILAPLGVMSFAVGTLPFTLAMKRKSAWQVSEVRRIEQNQPVTSIAES
jgi:hypothetical protein